MNVSDLTAVITGASRGLGAGLAEDFARRGMRLGLCARGPSVLSRSDRVVGTQLDVADGAATDQFCAEVAERFGHIDLWINNAGVLEPIGPLRDLQGSDVERHIAVNVMGVFHGSRAYVRHVRATKRPGVLVNISSGAGRAGYFGWSAYCAGKAAVDRMTECVALEEADTDLRVHSVAPGIIDTAMQEMIRGCSPEVFPLVEKFHELKRNNAFSTTDQVAKRLLALAFDPARRTDEVLIDLRD
jgi:benzil reductase ((S)-benzoin forming)